MLPILEEAMTDLPDFCEVEAVTLCLHYQLEVYEVVWTSASNSRGAMQFLCNLERNSHKRHASWWWDAQRLKRLGEFNRRPHHVASVGIAYFVVPDFQSDSTP